MGFDPYFQAPGDALNTCSKVNLELSKINKEQDKLNKEIQKTLNPTCDESNLWDDTSTDVELAKERIEEIKEDKVDLQSLFEALKKRES